jgi:hypothetical protein
MNKISQLLKNYERYVELPWSRGLAGLQKIWFAVYKPTDERRLRLHVDDFATATRARGHEWFLCDLTSVFGEWMSTVEYREEYFECPDDLSETTLAQLLDFAANKLRCELEQASDTDVVAVLGVASLFGFTKTSLLMQRVEASIPGRLLVFYPGEYENNNYRLLDARDGWNYLAVPITAGESAFD